MRMCCHHASGRTVLRLPEERCAQALRRRAVGFTVSLVAHALQLGVVMVMRSHVSGADASSLRRMHTRTRMPSAGCICTAYVCEAGVASICVRGNGSATVSTVAGDLIELKRLSQFHVSPETPSHDST